MYVWDSCIFSSRCCSDSKAVHIILNIIHTCLLNSLTTDDAIWRRHILAACYQLAQSVLKIGSALAERVGQGEVGGCTIVIETISRKGRLHSPMNWRRQSGPPYLGYKRGTAGWLHSTHTRRCATSANLSGNLVQPGVVAEFLTFCSHSVHMADKCATRANHFGGMLQ